MLEDVHYYITNNPPANSNNFALYISTGTLIFAIISYFSEKIISRNSKKKQIVRDWYKISFLDPSLQPINDFFENIKKLTYKHAAVFETKKDTLSKQDFLRYKGSITTDLQKTRSTFYNETLLPVLVNYPKIGLSANEFLSNIQDSFIVLFGGQIVNPKDLDQFINDLYLEKGKLLAVFRKPLIS